RFYTRHIAGLGEYRVTASHTPSGDDVITGLPLDEVNDTLATAVVLLVALSLSGLTIAGVAGTVVVRRMLRPLDRMATTAGEVAELPLDRGDVMLSARVAETDTDPHTEMGQVGAALNRMLGHIDNALAARHTSETRVRQFVADASHELRTPLASIRGYAELAARETQAQPNVAHAIDRIGSETRRMTALVDDLLLLARLDSGRPLERVAVDLSRLVVDTVSDARISTPEHHWKLVLPAEPVIALGDEARLHQVLANLLANSRSHTPPGSTVTTELAAEPDAAILRVTDDGPGIPAALQPDVFERFARGDSSRSRTAGGTGLGLAIVSAVVQAHHGTVQLHSEPGQTVFTVTLPAAQG
ncbi:MAG: sensor histidine kinase, partial [Mycobacteriales bacterium]